MSIYLFVCLVRRLIKCSVIINFYVLKCFSLINYVKYNLTFFIPYIYKFVYN